MLIGFIGLGNMGAPMAHNLAKAGHTVLGFDTQNLTVEMVEVVQTARDCAERAEVVITMLPNGKILKSGTSEFLANDEEARRLYLGERFTL